MESAALNAHDGKRKPAGSRPFECLRLCGIPRYATKKSPVPPVPRRCGIPSTRGTTRVRRSIRRFRRSQRGSAAIESAIGIAILVISLAMLMEIMNTVHASDRMGRAARAAARALAIDPQADACAAIRRELHLSAEFDCETTWTLTVDHGLSPLALPATLDAGAQTGTGDLVLVRIGWSHAPLSSDSLRTGESEADAVAKVAMGLARCE